MKMLKISNVVEEIIRKKPFLHEALNRGIVNNAALAEEILPEIEDKIGSEVKFQAVNMAIRRFAEREEEVLTLNMFKFSKETDIILRSNLVEITIDKTQKIQEIIKNIYDKVDIKQGDFLTITQGINEVMFITNKKNLSLIRSEIDIVLIKDVTEKLSTLTINIPVDFKDSVGFFFMISKTLAWENVNIVDIVSTLTEITVIVSEADASRTFDILNRMVRGNV